MPNAEYSFHCKRVFTINGLVCTEDKKFIYGFLTLSALNHEKYF